MPEEPIQTAADLLEQTEKNPEIIPFTVPPEGKSWVVTHTRPRCEKKLKYFCDFEGFPFFLPLMKKVHMYGNRRREFLNPLFSGYAFCIVPDDRKYYLMQNQYVANLLPVCDQQELVNQLNQIQKALLAGDEMEVLPYIQKGKQVKVLAGPFKGEIVEVVEAVKGSKVVVNIELIQQSVVFEIDPTELGII